MILKKNSKIFIFLFLTILGFLAYYFLDKNRSKNEIFLGTCKFDVEEAISKDSQIAGLSNRDSLCDKCGMIFIFSNLGKYGFWMKDMKFNLDFIWIKDNRVVDIKEGVSKDERSTLYSKAEFNKVLEINSGKISKCGIKIGDKVK